MHDAMAQKVHQYPKAIGTFWSLERVAKRDAMSDQRFSQCSLVRGWSNVGSQFGDLAAQRRMAWRQFGGN